MKNSPNGDDGRPELRRQSARETVIEGRDAQEKHYIERSEKIGHRGAETAPSDKHSAECREGEIGDSGILGEWDVSQSPRSDAQQQYDHDESDAQT